MLRCSPFPLSSFPISSQKIFPTFPIQFILVSFSLASLPTIPVTFLIELPTTYLTTSCCQAGVRVLFE